MSEVTTLSRPYKGLRSRRRRKDQPSAPGKERRRSRASLLSRWGPQSPSTEGVGRREPGWRLRPPLPPARSFRWLCPQRCSPRPGTARTWPSPSSGGARFSPSRLQPPARHPLGAPAAPLPGPAPPSPGRAQSLPVCPASLRARPGRRRWGGRARPSAAGSPARPSHCPQARDAAAPAQTQSPRLGDRPGG